MAAERGLKTRTGQGLGDDRGQSVLEFLLMLPMMVGLVVILVKVNTTIQISIVDQQYSRAQALWLTFSSPVYPLLRIREGQLTKKKYNQMVLGVSDNAAPAGNEPYEPLASTHYIARKKGEADNGDKEAKERALVRVRNTVTLCTQPNVVTGPGGIVPILPLADLSGGKGLSFAAGGLSAIGENPHQFDFCGSPMQYVMNSGSEP
jgi:hypothetical protein